VEHAHLHTGNRFPGLGLGLGLTRITALFFVQVDKLQKTATEQRAELTIKQQQADDAMEQIQKSMETAVERRKEVGKHTLL